MSLVTSRPSLGPRAVTMDSWTISQSRGRKKALSLNLTDVCRLAELDRLRESCRSRRHTIEEIHIKQFSPPPKNLPNKNRSLTEPHGAMLSKRATPVDQIIRRPSVSEGGERVGQLTCKRAESAMSIESKPSVGELPRQCCDVLGPGLCRDCSRLYRRHFNTRKSAHAFPNLTISARNLATTTILKKYLPNMSPTEIQKNVAMEYIDVKPFSPRDLVSSRELRQESFANSETGVHRLKNVVNDGTSLTYFNGIADLNAKIVSGRVPRRIDLMTDGSRPKSNKLRQDKTISERLFPTFVSTKKAVDVEKSLHFTPYSPPLLSVEQQNAEPSFFAGSDLEYTLPERLPSRLFSDTDEDEYKSWDSGSIATPSQGSARTERSLPLSVPSTPQESMKHPQYGLSS
ncbi:uncharacterized protein LOC106169643 [Lingula anatina]|uniref:Uncharacterized protein LOC106169643 n=1 Tax=Lingula anatina TaxID=7574 RepID=A0A1S3J462_LINAN|nr:uncharacterized protein LOC106169643 [Lingula anatina]|eukprot:XP_013404629.1 uncharacterized protein LOC106169643 [Lingula anatina]